MLARLWRFLTDPDISGRLLKDGEQHEVIADVVLKHWVVYVKPALVAVLGVVVWATTPAVRVDLGWLPLLVGTVLVLVAAFMALSRHIDRFVITSDKVFRVHGLVNRHEASMPLGRILDITVDKPIWGRMVGFGHFTFESAAQEQGLRDIRHVPRIDERNLTIQRVQRDAGLRSKKVRG